MSDLVQRGPLEEKASHSYVVEFLANALAKGLDPLPAKPKATLEEVKTVVSALRKEFREKNPGRDPLAELLAERRAEAERE